MRAWMELLDGFRRRNWTLAIVASNSMNNDVK